MDPQLFAKNYLDLLEVGDHQKLAQLFSVNGTVSSPIYGTLPALTFYQGLMQDTRSSKLVLDGVFHEEGTQRLIVLFDYHWTLKNGKEVIFKVSDLFEFNTLEKVDKLTIIYDTVVSRSLVNGL